MLSNIASNYFCAFLSALASILNVQQNVYEAEVISSDCQTDVHQYLYLCSCAQFVRYSFPEKKALPKPLVAKINSKNKQNTFSFAFTNQPLVPYVRQKGNHHPCERIKPNGPRLDDPIRFRRVPLVFAISFQRCPSGSRAISFSPPLPPDWRDSSASFSPFYILFTHLFSCLAHTQKKSLDPWLTRTVRIASVPSETSAPQDV